MSFGNEGITTYGLSIVYQEPYAQYQPRLIEPPAGSEVLADWRIFYELARRMGLKLAYRGQPVDMENAPTTTLPPGKMPQLRVMPMPADANVHGDVFGGWIMAQVDIAGALPAVRRANGRVATIAVNSFVFKQPVFVGDLLSFYAEIVKVGTTSITVNVEVYAERNRLPVDTVKVTEATLT